LILYSLSEVYVIVASVAPTSDFRVLSRFCTECRKYRADDLRRT